MKKLTFLAILIVLVVGSTSVLTTSARQDTTLVYWDTMNDNERPVMQEMIDICAAGLGVTVDYQYVPFSDAQNAYKTAAQAGNAPDIMRTEIAWGPEFAALGFLYDLSADVTEEEAAAYIPAAFNYNVWNGSIWGLPQVTDAPAMLYNKRLFTEAGLDPEVPPATMDEFKAAAIQISENVEGVSGFAYPWASYAFQPFMWAFGGGLIDADDLEIHIADQGTIDALNFVLSLVEEGAIVGEFDPANQYGNNMAAFKEGKVAIIFNGPWASSDVLSGAEFTDPANFGVAPIPAGPVGQGSPVGGHEYTIYAGSPFPAESLELVRCLNSVENQARLATELNLVPTVLAAYDDPALAENEILQGFLAQMQVATNRPVIPAGGQIYTDLDPAYSAVILGEKEPQEAMDEVKAAWENLLETMPK